VTVRHAGLQYDLPHYKEHYGPQLEPVGLLPSMSYMLRVDCSVSAGGSLCLCASYTRAQNKLYVTIAHISVTLHAAHEALYKQAVPCGLRAGLTLCNLLTALPCSTSGHWPTSFALRS
jgi:hypothetical protein